jgi:hypothetical protein
MAFKSIPLSRADFDERNWQEISEGCPEKECLSYEPLFFAKAKEAETAGDLKGYEVFTLLGAVSSFMLRSDSNDEPFAPKAVFRNSRSAILEDIPDSHLEALKDIASTIKDAEMRARVADVVWITKRDFRMAELAVEAYLESAKTLEDPNNWPACVDRIERATRIAVSLGSKNRCFAAVFTHIESVLDKYVGEDPLFLSAKMMQLLLEFGQGDPKKYGALAEKAASRAESENNWHRARTYWEIKAQWQDREKNLDAKRNALLNAAETYVKEAESALTRQSPSYMVASAHLEKAIEAQRRIGNKPRAEELHQLLLKYQAESVKELKPLSTNMEASDKVRAAIDEAVSAVKGKSFHDALFELALRLKLPTMGSLRKQAEKSAREHPLQHLITAFTVDGQGKVIGRRPSMLSNDPDEVEEALRAEMFFQASFSETIDVQWVLRPVMHQIVLEHSPRLTDFLAVVSNHPLVPDGREMLYAKGLQAGMRSDLDIAAHFLIPQFEHSVRYVLAQSGIITSSIDQEGIQQEYDLNKTLYMPAVKEAFGADVVFHLQRILVERLGGNLRNRMAHGMMSSNEFFSVPVAYLWWLILKLICLPVIAYQRKKDAEGSGSSVGDTETTEPTSIANTSEKPAAE